MTSQLAGRRTVGIFIEAGNPFVAVTTARGIVIKAVCRNFDYPLRYRRDRPIIILIRPWLAIAPPGEMSREPTVETPVQTLYRLRLSVVSGFRNRCNLREWVRTLCGRTRTRSLCIHARVDFNAKLLAWETFFLLYLQPRELNSSKWLESFDLHRSDNFDLVCYLDQRKRERERGGGDTKVTENVLVFFALRRKRDQLCRTDWDLRSSSYVATNIRERTSEKVRRLCSLSWFTSRVTRLRRTWLLINRALNAARTARRYSCMRMRSVSEKRAFSECW